MHSSEPHRILLIADAAFDRDLLEAALSFRCIDPEDAEVCLVAPARRHVQERLARSWMALVDVGLGGRSWIGDPDPLVAIDDALHRFRADELVVVEDRERGRFGRHRELALEAALRFSLPTLDVIADPHGDHIVVSLERTSLAAAVAVAAA
jgi:hypothetical protein